ncbi:MAG TPA: hypothetical protein VL137_05060 [Polyangiaceae bacterium]|jgi:Flp pilus assembly pilin Flp|nr:hypothetical protein [Polyangiaceae bacterium]
MISISTIQNRLRKLVADDRGLSTVEYVIVLVLIAAVAMGTWQKFGSMVKGKIEHTTDTYDETVTAEEGEGDPGGGG